MNEPESKSEKNRVLIVVAAPRECRAVLDGLGAKGTPVPDAWELVRIDDRFDVVMSGVGKSNAAGAAARFLDPRYHARVLSVGIAGALPGSGLELLDTVVATRSVFADEGIGADNGFIPMSDAGFGAFPDGTMHLDHAESVRIPESKLGIVATVSWCSGSDACAQGVVDRTGAVCEAMEGASVALAAARIDPSIKTGEIRVISNTTGDRANQRWELGGSLERLREVLGRVSVLLR